MKKIWFILQAFGRMEDWKKIPFLSNSIKWCKIKAANQAAKTSY